MLTGETVYIEDRVKVGETNHKEPLFETSERAVDNVLIAPRSTSDIAEATRPDGVMVAYKLYFPKTFDESLRGKRVKVYGEWFDVIGDPRPWRNPLTPTDWWLTVEVSATNG